MACFTLFRVKIWPTWFSPFYSPLSAIVQTFRCSVVCSPESPRHSNCCWCLIYWIDVFYKIKFNSTIPQKLRTLSQSHPLLLLRPFPSRPSCNNRLMQGSKLNNIFTDVQFPLAVDRVNKTQRGKDTVQQLIRWRRISLMKDSVSFTICKHFNIHHFRISTNISFYCYGLAGSGSGSGWMSLAV